MLLIDFRVVIVAVPYKWNRVFFSPPQVYAALSAQVAKNMIQHNKPGALLVVEEWGMMGLVLTYSLKTMSLSRIRRTHIQ